MYLCKLGLLSMGYTGGACVACSVADAAEAYRLSLADQVLAWRF